MIVKLPAFPAATILLALFSACSSQPSAGPSGSAQPTQKCEVDVKRVCEEVRNRPVVDSQTGQTQDRTEREQNSTRTDTRIVSFQVPNGSMVEVQCEINNEHNSVVYAHLMSGPALTPTDVSFLKNAGYCAH